MATEHQTIGYINSRSGSAPKLMKRLRLALRSRHYSSRTEQAYCLWVKHFIYFHKIRHPAEMAEPEINAFLTHLAVKNKVSASTQRGHLSAARRDPASSRATALALIAVLTLTGCAVPRIVGQATVSGASGSAEAEPVTTLQVVRHQSEASNTPRVAYSAGAVPFANYTGVSSRLVVLEERNPDTRPEAYHFVTISPDTPAPLVGQDFSGDGAAFMRAHVGRFVHLIRRQAQSASSSGFGGDNPQGNRRVGAAWLARVEDDDPFIPWQVMPGGALPCFAMPGSPGTCFSMQTLSREILTGIATEVEAGVADIPGVSVVGHSLLFVPRVSHPAFEAANRPARGFGFIYQANIVAPLVSFQVYAPVSFLFERDGPQDFRIHVDPMTPEFMVAGQTVQWQNPDRIALEAGGPVGLLAGPITDAIRDGLAEATLPEFNLGSINNVPINVTAEEGLALIVRQFMGTGPGIPSNFDVMLLPEGESGNRNVLLFTPNAAATPIDQNQVRLVFLR